MPARVARGAPLHYPTKIMGPPLTILMSLMVAMLRTNRFTWTMAGPSRVMIIMCYIYIYVQQANKLQWHLWYVVVHLVSLHRK